MTGRHKYAVSDFFNTRVEENNGTKKLFIYHAEGCQTLDFGETQNLPRQSEVLTALKVLGVDMQTILALQYGGRNKYTLYPRSNMPVLTAEKITINGHLVEVSLADPIVRDIVPVNADVFISGNSAGNTVASIY